MPEKIKIALAQGATCSGGDIAVLDLDVELLKLFEVADLTFAPLATDIKYKDVEAMADQEIDVCVTARTSMSRNFCEKNPKSWSLMESVPPSVESLALQT